MKFNQSLEDALYAWAASEQSAMAIGYPSVAAGFSEYQSGYRISSRVPSQYEMDVLRLVERGINKMRQWEDDKPYQCLKEYYGAYPGALTKDIRLKNLFAIYKKRPTYNAISQAKTYLQGIIDIYATT